MDILNRSDLPLDRVGGAREYCLVAGPEGGARAWTGLGDFVWLTDARCAPAGETGERTAGSLNLVTLVADGRVDVDGSLHSGMTLAADEVLIQCGGSAGFTYGERNPDAQANRVVRIGLTAGGGCETQRLALKRGRVNRVYDGGGDTPTRVEIALLDAGQSLDVDTPFVAYLVSGAGFANEDQVSEGMLFSDEQLTFDATEDTRLVIVHRHG